MEQEQVAVFLAENVPTGKKTASAEKRCASLPNRMRSGLFVCCFCFVFLTNRRILKINGLFLSSVCLFVVLFTCGCFVVVLLDLIFLNTNTVWFFLL